MEPHQSQHDLSGQRRVAAGDLVTLDSGVHVLQQQHEFRAVAPDGRVIAARRRDLQPRPQTVVEADLSGVGAHHDGHVPGHLVAGRELPDDRGRVLGPWPGVGEHETHTGAELAGTDGGMAEAEYLGVGVAGAAQHLAQPLGRHLVEGGDGFVAGHSPLRR
ncbi:MAG: hypothetical protein OXG55_09060 [bacterium]|nr:hypothetical protein [bacterium]